MNSIYQIALALHILGALGLVSALGMEAVVMSGLRRSVTAEDGRAWLASMRVVRVLGPVSMALILVAGLYMTAAVWRWTGWNVVGILGLLAIGAIGGVVNGRALSRIGPAVGRGHGPLSDEVLALLASPALRMSLWARTGIVVGVVFIMTLKPGFGASLAIVVISAGLGVAYALLPKPQNVGRGSSTRTPSAVG